MCFFDTPGPSRLRPSTKALGSHSINGNGHHTRVTQMKVTRDASTQTDDVSEGATEPRHLFFYSTKEFLLFLFQQDHIQAGAVCVCVRVCMGRRGVSPMPGELSAAQSQGKLCFSAGSELLKQSSADKPCVLSPRDRAKA